MIKFVLHEIQKNWKSTGEMRRWIAPIVILSVFVFSGCDLFEVENPNDVLEEELQDPELIPSLGNSAEGALSETYDWAVQMGGMPGDGVIDASTNQGGVRPDRGIFEGFNEYTAELWDELSAARWTATEATRRLEELVDDPDANIHVAKSYYWDAVARITLADLFEEVPFDGGEPNSPEEVYEGAIDRLERAIEIAQASDAEESTKYEAVSYATMARAYRSLYFERDEEMSMLREAANAAQNALDVDSDFFIAIKYQTPGSQNGVFSSLSRVQQQNMDPGMAGLTDPVSGEEDPRIEYGEPDGVGVQGDTLYPQMKYDNLSADIPVSRWQEAELILAEYDLESEGDVGAAETHINRVRTEAGLQAFSSNDPQEVQDQIIYERKAEFWLEVRRWQDMRYYEIIPERWNPDSKEQGVDRRYHVSDRERGANPNY